MTYLWSPLHPRISNGIFMRLSDDLMHWSEHEGILPFNFYYKTYAPLTHDLLETKDGKIKYMIVSQWISPRKMITVITRRLWQFILNNVTYLMAARGSSPE